MQILLFLGFVVLCLVLLHDELVKFIHEIIVAPHLVAPPSRALGVVSLALAAQTLTVPVTFGVLHS